jgi:hypothetical protein
VLGVGVPVGRGGRQKAVGAHGERVGALAGAARDGVDGGAEGFGEEDAEVADSAAGFGRGGLAGKGGGKGGTYMPTMPTFLPGPMPFRTSGEYAVSPAHSMGAASSDARPSGMGKVKCSWARMCDE